MEAKAVAGGFFATDDTDYADYADFQKSEIRVIRAIRGSLSSTHRLRPRKVRGPSTPFRPAFARTELRSG